MKINKELADTIVRLRYGCEKDKSINLKNVRKHFHHRQMTRTTEEIVDSLRILYKDADFYQKLTGRQIQNFLKERLSLFRSLDFDGQKISKYIRFSKQGGYWLKNRKYCYAYWFRFLQIAAIEKKRKVDWSKYKGWGGKAEILKKEYPKCNFDDWFKERGVKLFAVKKPTDKALFEPTKRPQLDAVQYSYEVYCKVLDNPKMTNEEVFKQLDKKYPHLKIQRDIREVDSVVGASIPIYKHYANTILNNVCKGIFPGSNLNKNRRK